MSCNLYTSYINKPSGEIMKKLDIYELVEKDKDYIEYINKNVFAPIKEIDISQAVKGLSHKKVKSTTPKKITYDMLVSNMMKQKDSDKYLCFTYRSTSAIIAQSLSDFGMKQASIEQMSALMNIAGYNPEELIECYRNSFHNIAFNLIRGSEAQVVLLAKVIYDTLQTGSNSRLLKISKYMEDNDLLVDHIENEESEYDIFIENHIRSNNRSFILDKAIELSQKLISEKLEVLNDILHEVNKISMEELKTNPDYLEMARKSIMDENEGRHGHGFLVEKSPETIEKIQIIEALENRYYEISDRTSTFINDEIKKNDEFIAEAMKNEYPDSVGVGAWTSLINGDDIWKYPIATYIWTDVAKQCNMQLYAVDYSLLEDEDDWDYQFTELNEGGSYVVKSNEFIKVPVMGSFAEDFEDKITTLPLHQVLANYAEHYIPSTIILRKSIMQMFRNAGLSERRARDLAVIAAFCQEIHTEENFWDISKSLECQFRYYCSDASESRAESITPVENNTSTTSSIETEEIPSDEIEARNKEIEELKKKLKEAEDTNKRYHHEIILQQRYIDDLNEKLKQKTSKEKAREEIPLVEEEPIDYPYETDMKITLYGGFDTFHKELQKLIPSIRIIEPGSKLSSVEPLRNADIVFVQPNKLNHSNYFAVRDATRNANVPFYHLKFAGAQRCADFIVRTIEEKFPSGKH